MRCTCLSVVVLIVFQEGLDKSGNIKPVVEIDVNADEVHVFVS